MILNRSFIDTCYKLRQREHTIVNFGNALSVVVIKVASVHY